MSLRRAGFRPVMLRAAASLGIVAALAGCARGYTLPPRPAPSMLPADSPLASRSLADADAWLRHYLMTGQYEAALGLINQSGRVVGDGLLGRLQLGIVLHHAGRYEESNQAFQWAEQEADRRYTRSATRAAGSLLVNDRVLAYTPGRAELAAIPYYRMLNYLALRQVDAAAVEARKASALMASRAGSVEKVCEGDAFLQYFSGLVFSAAREPNDALVSFRQAERSFDACAERSGVAAPEPLASDLIRTARSLGIQEVADAAAERYGTAPEADSAAAGDLIVLIEHGFAAHRAQENLYLPVFTADTAGLRDDDDGLRILAERVTARLAGIDAAEGDASYVLDRAPRVRWEDGADAAYVLKLAWPVARRETYRPTAVRLHAGSTVVQARPAGDLSALLVRDLEAQRPLLLARMVARGVAKYALSQEAEKKAEKQGGEAAAFLVGLVTNTAANALEQADTRSWSLLPDQISLVRMRLPAGEHSVWIETLAPDGTPLGTLDLGAVRVNSGESVFLSRRVWTPATRDHEESGFRHAVEHGNPTAADSAAAVNYARPN